MHASLATAGRTTHLRVVAFALAASVAVLTVGLTARAPTNTVTVQIAKPAMVAISASAVIR